MNTGIRYNTVVATQIKNYPSYYYVFTLTRSLIASVCGTGDQKLSVPYRDRKNPPSSFFSLFLGELLGVGASKEMLILSFFGSRCEGARRIINVINEKMGGVWHRIKIFTCKIFYGFLTNDDESSACYLPNPYTHRSCF